MGCLENEYHILGNLASGPVFPPEVNDRKYWGHCELLAREGISHCWDQHLHIY